MQSTGVQVFDPRDAGKNLDKGVSAEWNSFTYHWNSITVGFLLFKCSYYTIKSSSHKIKNIFLVKPALHFLEKFAAHAAKCLVKVRTKLK